MSDQAGSLGDRGIQAFREGRTEDAVRLLKEAVSEDPRDQRAYLVLGAAYIQRREYDEAVAAFERARDLRYDLPHVHYNLGLAYQKVGRPQDAIAAFRAAVEIDPSYEKAKEALDRAVAPTAPASQPPSAQAAPPGIPELPDEQPPAGPRMPMVPGAPPPAPAPAPWQSAAGKAKAGDDVSELRPLGGEAEPQPAPASQGPQPRSDEPARAPWELEGMQVRQRARPRPEESEGKPPRRRERAPARMRTGGAARGAKAPEQGQYAAAGALTGALYGAIFLVVLMVIDRALGRNWGIVTRLNYPSLIPLIIGGGMLGAVLGAIIGSATAVTANPSVGIGVSVGLWALMLLIIFTRAGVSGTPLILGLALSAVYGAVMGWAVATQVQRSIKRQ